jgi:hypothetical protein
LPPLWSLLMPHKHRTLCHYPNSLPVLYFHFFLTVSRSHLTHLET